MVQLIGYPYVVRTAQPLMFVFLILGLKIVKSQPIVWNFLNTAYNLWDRKHSLIVTREKTVFHNTIVSSSRASLKPEYLVQDKTNCIYWVTLT